MSRLAALALAVLTSGCMAQHTGSTSQWYAAHDAVAPRMDRVVVCHGYGCRLKTATSFGPREVAAMRRALGRPKSAAAERDGIRRLVAWAERRVAAEVGSADDIPGMDFRNAGVAGQLDCIDEAANTTSYLTFAARAGLLRFHTVGRPVARGYFLDRRYPHATATVVGPDGPWAIDSWPTANGALPDVMPLATWYQRRTASRRS